jgi:hypothetical protein
MNEKEEQQLITRQYLDAKLDAKFNEVKQFVLDRETALIWKVIALQVTLIGAIAGAQWVALITLLQHWKHQL